MPDYIKVLLVLFIAFGLNAQNTEPQYRHFGVEDGLPSKETYQVFQDSRGFVWVATDRGVVRYNGVEFELFNKTRGMPDNVVFRFYEDDNARVWFIPITGNLSYFDGEKITVYKHNRIINQHLDGLVRSIHVSQNGSVTIGSMGGVLNIEPDGTFQVDTVQSKEKTVVNYISHPEKGVIFKGSNRISISNTVTIYWNGVTTGTYDHRVSKTNADYRYALSKDGTLIFSLLNKIYTIDRHGKIIVEKSLPGPVTFVTIIDQLIWVGAEGNGVFAFNLQGKEVHHFLTDLSVSYVLKDQQGSFWFSTLEKGVYFTSSFRNERLINSSKINEELICSMDGNERDLLLCDRDGNFVHISTDNEMYYFRLMDAPSPAHIKHIESEQSFVISSMGPVIYEPRKRKIRFSPKQMRPVHYTEFESPKELMGEFLWEGGKGAIRHLKKDRFERIIVNNKLRIFTAIQQLDNGNIYCGSLNGLYLWSGKTVVKVPALAGKRIVDICSIGNTAYVATRGSGLFILEAGKARSVTTKNGLVSNELTSICIDFERNHLWIGSTKGAQVFDVRKNKIIKSYSTSNGLAGNDIYGIHAMQSKVYIATNNGVSVISPNLSNTNTYVDIPFYFLSYTVNSKRKLLPASVKRIELEYMEQLSEIEFAYLDFANGNPTGYEYMLEGYSATWNKTQNNKLQFIGLPPGNYTLKVRKSGEKKIISMPIYIKAPLWQKSWFIFTLVIVGLFVISGITYVIYRNRSQRKHAQRNALVLQQTALTSQMNPHFIFNSLNSIQAYIFKNRIEDSTRYLSKFSKLIRTILESSFETSISLKEELSALDQYINLEKMRMKGQFHYRISNEVTLNPTAVQVPPFLLQPFVENAIWHGLSEVDNGELSVIIRNNAERLYFIIDDNGAGRVKSSERKKTGKSRGAFIAEQRMQNFCRLHRSEHTMKIIDKTDADGSPSGTRVEFSITLVYDQNHSHRR